MARIAGVDLPREKRVEIGLTYIYGIGLTTSKKILASTGVNPDTRVKDLTEDDISKLRDYIDKNIHVEGDALHRLVGWVQLIGAAQDIFLHLSQHHTLKGDFEHDGRFHLAQGPIVEEFLEMRLVSNLETIGCPTDGFEEGGLTTAVHTTY